jgi:DNA repair protein RecO (recombination protein O)
MLAQARTWDIVTEAVTVESYRHLRADLDAISRAGFIAELIDAFAESDDDHRPLWELATDSLRELDAACVAGSTVDREVLLQWFVLHLLSITGFEPQLFSCLECEEELQPVTNFVSLIEGGVLCPKCGANRSELEAVEPEILKVLRYLQSRGWGEARGLTLRPQTVRRVENLLGRYLITILERQLRSTDFLRRIRSDPRFSG